MSAKEAFRCQSLQGVYRPPRPSSRPPPAAQGPGVQAAADSGMLHTAPPLEQGMKTAQQSAPDMAEACAGWYQPAHCPGHPSLEARTPFPSGLYPGSVSGPLPPAWPRAQHYTGAARQQWCTSGALPGVQAPLPPPEHCSSLYPNPALSAWLAAGTPTPGHKGGLPAFPRLPPGLGPWHTAGVPGVPGTLGGYGFPLASGAAMGAGRLAPVAHPMFCAPPAGADMLLSEMEDAWGRDEGWLAVPDETRAAEQDEDEGATEERTEGGARLPRENEASPRLGGPFEDPLLRSDDERGSLGPAPSAGDACSKWAGPAGDEPWRTGGAPQGALQAEPSCSGAEPQFPDYALYRRGGRGSGLPRDEARDRERSEGNSEPLAPSCRKRGPGRKANSDSSLPGGGGGAGAGAKGAAPEGAYTGESERSGGEKGRHEVADGEEGRKSEQYGLGSHPEPQLPSHLRVACGRREHFGSTGGNGCDGDSCGPSPKKSRLHAPLGPGKPSPLSAQHHPQPQHPQPQQQRQQHPQQQQHHKQHLAAQDQFDEETGDEQEEEGEEVGHNQWAVPNARAAKGLIESPAQLPPTARGLARHGVGVPKAHLDYAMGSFVVPACDKGQARPLPCIFRSKDYKGFH